MCLNLKFIPNRSKVLSPYHRERFLVPCKCGRCAECQSELHETWYFRIYHEWLDCLAKPDGSFVFFTTLTYANEYLPHLSEFIDGVKDTSVDFPCFCYEDVREFLRSLRRKLDYDGYDITSAIYKDGKPYKRGLRFFYCSEYGTSDEYRDGRGRTRKATHRPHYHMLCFCNVPGLSVQKLRAYIDDAWFFGRTDKVRLYGEHANVFYNTNKVSELAVSNYVAKYVQKVSLFQKEIDSRLDQALHHLYEDRFTRYEPVKIRHDFDEILSPITESHFSFHNNRCEGLRAVFDDDAYRSWCGSYSGKKLKADLLRLVDQFHRQSQGFGLSALESVDLNELEKTGKLTMPDKNRVIRTIPLPKYYERKLYERLVTYDGVRVWEPTDDGMRYRRLKDARSVKLLSAKYSNLIREYNLDIHVDTEKLARYVVYYRGRLDGSIAADVRFSDKINLPDLFYNYCTPTDKALFHGAFVSHDFVGCQGLYYSHCLDNAIPMSVFIQKYVINSEKKPQFKGFDAILDRLRVAQIERNKSKQASFDLHQRLKNAEHAKCQLSLSL